MDDPREDRSESGEQTAALRHPTHLIMKQVMDRRHGLQFDVAPRVVRTEAMAEQGVRELQLDDHIPDLMGKRAAIGVDGSKASRLKRLHIPLALKGPPCSAGPAGVRRSTEC